MYKYIYNPPYPNCGYINRISLIKRAVAVGVRPCPICQLDLAETASFPCFNAKHPEQRPQMVAPGQWCKIYHAISLQDRLALHSTVLWALDIIIMARMMGMKPKQHVRCGTAAHLSPFWRKSRHALEWSQSSTQLWDVAPQHVEYGSTFLLFADANPSRVGSEQGTHRREPWNHGPNMFRTARQKGACWKTHCLSHQTFSEWRILQIAQLQSSLRQAWDCWSRWMRQTKSQNPVVFCASYPEKLDVEYGSIGSPKISQNRVLPLCTMLIYIASGYSISHDNADSRVGK